MNSSYGGDYIEAVATAYFTKAIVAAQRASHDIAGLRVDAIEVRNVLTSGEHTLSQFERKRAVRNVETAIKGHNRSLNHITTFIWAARQAIYNLNNEKEVLN